MCLVASIATTITSALPLPTPWNDGWLNLTVIHTNDVHSRVDPANDVGVSCTSQDVAVGQCYGGSARHKTVIERLRQSNQHSLLLDGGDEFQGTLFYTYYKGNVTAEVMNELGYDLGTIGNHEWDDGPLNLGRFWPKLKFPIVCANVDLTKHPELAKWVKPYHIFEDIGVGVIGYITNTTGDISNAGPSVVFTDPIPAVQKYVDELEAKGIKRIITLSHNGYKDDMILAANTRGVDLIVGGHSHSYLGESDNPLSEGPYPTIVKNLDGEEVPIVQAFCWGRYIGHLDVTFNPDGKIVAWKGAPILVEHSIPADPQLLERIDGWRNEFEDWGKIVLGVATAPFEQGGCKLRECSMGNLVADGMLSFSRGLNQEQARETPYPDMAFINGGGIRSGLPTGNITVEMIMTTSPFGNRLAVVELAGEEILAMLESMSTGYNQATQKRVTSIVQLSGMRYTFDSSRPAGEPRLTQAEFLLGQEWIEIEKEETYWVVTMDFVLNGGDNILERKDGRRVIVVERLDKALMEYIKIKHSVTPYLDGRIKDIAVNSIQDGDKFTSYEGERFKTPIWPISTPEHIKSQYPGGFEEMLKDYERLRSHFGVQKLEKTFVFEVYESQQEVLA
ncbi:hypothetical protein BGZ65_001189 [Modicella reniformis]|uniref:Metallo-dependent phosphatase n=1 Tax=Modicella reniformis TaxID=1440133 RepID=A0A9P6LT35_9FUNG|nr:hypothetical protein BGZ65_001189 [Modicella reniformis]